MSGLDIWLTIIFLGLGTFLLRYSFIGLVGERKFPEWMMRHLRYVPVAVMPGLIAPLIVWPQATGGETDHARLISAAVALLIGSIFKSVVGAVIGGMITLYLMLYLLG
ncbi:MAG: AzlD domain-containing protein [Paracoccaceae bacterium]